MRFTPLYPVYPDPAFLAFLLLSFLFLIRNQFGLSFLFLAIAYPFREPAIYIAPLFLFFASYLGGEKGITFVKFSVAFLAIVASKVLIENYMVCDGNQLNTAITWARRGLADPQRFVRWFAGISMTAAPLVYMRKIDSLIEGTKNIHCRLCSIRNACFFRRR